MDLFGETAFIRQIEENPINKYRLGYILVAFFGFK